MQIFRHGDLCVSIICVCVAEEKWTSGRSDPPKVGPSLAFLGWVVGCSPKSPKKQVTSEGPDRLFVRIVTQWTPGEVIFGVRVPT
jgi:hypothetical protein